MKWIKIGFCFLMVFLLWIRNHNYISLQQYQSETKTIEIKGFVASPGIYEVEWDASVHDVLQLAGGTLSEADLSSINQSKVVENHEVIVIPDKKEVCISISSASKEELMELPSIGEVSANHIIEYRQEHPFISLEDIMNVSGIKEKTFEKLKEFICL